MLISELARHTGLSTDTIRFYEKQGVLDATHSRRSPNNYRDYNEAAVERLILVKRAQLAGFTLTEICALAKQWEMDQLTDQQKEAVFTRKIKQIDERIADLSAIRSYLTSKIAHLHRVETEACVPHAEKILA